MVDIEFADSAATAYSKKQGQCSPYFKSWPKRQNVQLGNSVSNISCPIYQGGEWKPFHFFY